MTTTRSDLSRLQDEQDVIATQIGKLLVARDFTVRPKRPEGRGPQLTSEPSESRHAVDEQLGPVSTVANDFTTKTAALPSWISHTHLSYERSASFAALQIARKLDNTRRQALRSKLERIFTIDVGTRLLEEVPGSKLLQLDPALELRLISASSEVINERSGRIRFFPDGSSTGGRIQVQHDKDRATVNVDRPTGVVTVQVMAIDRQASRRVVD
jgi:general secretion pathway protein H